MGMYPFSTKMREALGNLEGEEDGFPNTSWVLVESWVLVDILLTTNPSPSECDGSENESNPSLPTGMDFLIHPCRWIDDEENVRTPPKL